MTEHDRLTSSLLAEAAAPPASPPAPTVSPEPGTTEAVGPPVVVINGRQNQVAFQLAELWRYRELILFFAWRDISVRYKQAVLGIGWAIFGPLMTMLVFTVVFGQIAGLGAQTGGVPYELISLSAVLPWTMFASCLNLGSNSIVGNANLIRKVYFSRLVIPLSSVGSPLVDFTVASTVMFGLMAYFGVALTPQILLLPLLVLGALLAATGVSMILSAVMTTYRDVRHVIAFLVQLWMYVTPVAYTIDMIPERWQWAVMINPVSGIIHGFRGAFLGTELHWDLVARSLAMAAALFLIGLLWFIRAERRFADLI